MTTLALTLWCAVAAVPLLAGALLRWPHVVVPVWRRPGVRRARLGGVLLVAGLWISPAWQLPVGALSARWAFARLEPLRGASSAAFADRTGRELRPLQTEEFGWTPLAPLGTCRVDVVSWSGTTVDLVRLDTR